MIVAFDPIERIIHEEPIDVNLILEITDDLIILGVHVVLSDMIVFKLHYKVGKFLEFAPIKIILHHEFKDFLFFGVKVKHVKEDKQQTKKL